MIPANAIHGSMGVSLPREKVKLWWPRGFGEQPLYTVEVRCMADGAVVDSHTRRIGLRTLSVSRAVGLLKNGGYLTVEDGHLTLTQEGKEVGRKIFERHKILTRCLMALGVDVATAAEDACRLEHAISDTSFAAIKAPLERAGMLD